MQFVLESGVRRVRGGFGLVWRIAKLDKEWGISMRFRHPLLLLLGGLISASSVGCSAVTAVVSDTRPAARQGRGSADKYAAIARVYENQGRYDQAEAMYRKALKQNPNNTEVRSSLQQLANRKTGRKFGNEIRTEAIAKAEAAQKSVVETAVPLNAKAPNIPASLSAQANLSAPATPNASVTPETIKSELKTASLSVDNLTTELSSEAGKLSPASFEETVAEVKAEVKATATNAVKAVEVEVATLTTTTEAASTVQTKVTAAKPSSEQLISAEQILAVVEMPAEHADLLLRGLKHGDSLETQCLAATLLGDCDRSRSEIRDALRIANEAATDAYLRLAICDSRIQRAEHDEITAKCLINVLKTGSPDLQVQVCASMHHFVGSQSESACAAALESALTSDSPDVRAGAAVALGDFPSLSESAKNQLKKMAASDPAEAVREAASASADRYSVPDDSKTDEILVMPRK